MSYPRGETVYHGTNSQALLRIKQKGLCHGLPSEDRQFTHLNIKKEEKTIVEDAIYVTRSPRNALMWASIFSKKKRKPFYRGVYPIIKFNMDDARKANCYIKKDKHTGSSWKILCDEKCFWPKAEVCFLITENRLPLLHDPQKAAKALRNCKWKPLRWEK